jgi:hypothetical protein
MAALIYPWKARVFKKYLNNLNILVIIHLNSLLVFVIFVLFAAKLWTPISYQGAFLCSNLISSLQECCLFCPIRSSNGRFFVLWKTGQIGNTGLQFFQNNGISTRNGIGKRIFFMKKRNEDCFYEFRSTGYASTKRYNKYR